MPEPWLAQPTAQELGLTPSDVWHTAYGNYPARLLGFVAEDFTGHWWPPLPILGGTRQKLSILIPITEGPRFQLVSVSVEGNAKAARAEVAALIASVPVPGAYDYSVLEATRQKIVDALGHSGYALAQVQLEQNIDDSACTVGAVYRIFAGDPVAIGRINFQGNTRLREKFLRREVVSREGEIFDSARLDQSINRLNRKPAPPPADL